MATPTGVLEAGFGPVGGEGSEPHRCRSTDGSPTGPSLLLGAAAVLPPVAGRGPLRCVDLHTALVEGACLVGMGRDRHHRLRLADQALDLFAAYLVASRRAAPADRSKDVVQAWLACADLADVQLSLAAAAADWLTEPASSDPLWKGGGQRCGCNPVQASTEELRSERLDQEPA